jgi:hypothetical protein
MADCGVHRNRNSTEFLTHLKVGESEMKTEPNVAMERTRLSVMLVLAHETRQPAGSLVFDVWPRSRVQSRANYERTGIDV